MRRLTIASILLLTTFQMDAVAAEPSVNQFDALMSAIKQIDDQRSPVGSVSAYCGQDATVLPVNWKVCNGDRLERQKYPKLFAVIGERWGKTPDQQYFLLPDLQGYFLRGIDLSGTGRDVEVSARIPLGTGNPAEVGSLQNDATKLPNNSFRTAKDGAHYHQDPTYNDQSGPFELAKATTTYGADYGAQSAKTEFPGESAHEHVVASGGDPETRPKNVSVLWIIRVK